MSDPAAFVAFIHAQLDEDERVARAVANGAWLWNDYVDDNGEAFIGRFGDARVLSEVDAKRRILDRHSGATQKDECPGCGAWLDGTWRTPPGALCPEQIDMALSYAGHEGYREEWRPA